jgi:hypothetical protein
MAVQCHSSAGILGSKTSSKIFFKKFEFIERCFKHIFSKNPCWFLFITKDLLQNPGYKLPKNIHMTFSPSICHQRSGYFYVK